MQPNNQNQNSNPPQPPHDPIQQSPPPPPPPPQQFSQETSASQVEPITPTQSSQPLQAQPPNGESILPTSQISPQPNTLNTMGQTEPVAPSFEKQVANAAASIVAPNEHSFNQTPGLTQPGNDQPTQGGSMRPIVGGVAQANDKAVKLTSDDEKQKSKKKIIIALAGTLALVIIATVSTLAYFAMQLTPEQLLAKSVIKSATTSTVKQEYSATGNAQSLSVVAETDLADPSKPRAKGNYSAMLDSAGIKLQVDYDFICTSEEDCQVKFTKIDVEPEEYGKILAASVKKDEWLDFNPTKLTTSFEANFTNAIVGIVTPLGEVINGKIEGEALDLITKHAEAGDIFKIKSYEDVDLDGMKTTKYNLEPDVDIMKDINKAVAEQYDLKNSKNLDTLGNTPDNVDIWIDKKSKQIVQIYFEDDGLDLYIKYSAFDEELNIETPK